MAKKIVKVKGYYRIINGKRVWIKPHKRIVEGKKEIYNVRNFDESELKQILKKVRKYGAESYHNYEIWQKGDKFEIIEKGSIKFHIGRPSTSYTSQKKPKSLGYFTEKELVNFFINNRLIKID